MFRFVLSGFCIALLAGPVSAGSLGEIAQKEKTRREKEGKGTKVLTEEDLKNAKGETFSVTGATTSTSRSRNKTPAPRSASSPKPSGTQGWDSVYSHYKKSFDTTRGEIEILTRVSQRCSPGETIAEYDQTGRLVTWKCDEIISQKASAEATLTKLQDDLEQQARRRGLAPGRADLQ